MRCAPVYKLNRWSRKNPISVMFFDAANSTARLDGGPMATTIPMPAIEAFCNSSKQARPLSKRIDDESGKAWREAS